jgi:predicted DNA-binding transcriptional regulator YafY
MWQILSSMLDTSSRLLRLLSLLQTRPDWSGAELAARLEVTGRTLRRDVQRLRDLDYPVYSVPGVAGGYRLGPGATLPPLLLDDDEAIAVVLSLRSTTSHTVSGLAEASVRALAKLDQVLPARLRERTAALQHATVALAGPAAVDQEMLISLAAACRRHQRLRLSYRDHAGRDSVRLAEPHRVVSAGYRWYLMAFDLERDGWRTFRVDRIGAADDTGVRFTPRQAPDAAGFVAAAVTTAPYRYQARIIVHATMREMAERVSPSEGVLSDLDGTRCVLTTGSDSLEAMTFHLSILGAEFTVLEPPELVGHLRAVAGRLARASAQATAG